jgi:alpha-beta hydrolase superfamily lysophospholipase
MDFNIKLSSGQVLKGLILSPGENTRAVIIMVHGIGEHMHRYLGWADMFIKQGVGFVGVDLPGHGRSPGRRGHIRNYEIVKEMLDILISSSRKTFPGIPLYIYGHSLGGGIVLDYILRNNPRISGAIVTSPWLRLSFEPPKIKIILASVVKNIIPWLSQPTGLIVEHISHDIKEVEKYKSDPLVHDKCSVSLFHSAMSAGKYALEHSGELKISTLILHGSDDKICSPEGSREFASKNKLTDIKIFEGGYHELHNELFRNEVFDYIIKWIDKKH